MSGFARQGAKPEDLESRTHSGVQLGGRPLLTVLQAVCAAVGLDGQDAELIKFTNNAVFRLHHEPVVVRIAGSTAVRKRTPKVVRVARWLEAHEIPAVRLLPDVEQPVFVEGQLATLWREVPAVGPSPTGYDLGRILHAIHALPEPEEGLPPWRPLDEVRHRLAEPEDLPDDDLDFLLTRSDEVEAEIADLDFDLPHGPVHGDAFLGNLVPGPACPVIADFDSTCTGPREWDLTPIAVGALRFNYPGSAHRDLTEAYGFDVTGWPGFPVLRAVRELKLVTSVIPTLRSNPRHVPQWRHRLDSFKSGDLEATWTPYQ